MGKALLGWAGFLGLVLLVVHAFTSPPSARQQAATAAGHRALEVAEVRAENARIACASGVERACP